MFQDPHNNKKKISKNPLGPYFPRYIVNAVHLTLGPKEKHEFVVVSMTRAR